MSAEAVETARVDDAIDGVISFATTDHDACVDAFNTSGQFDAVAPSLPWMLLEA